MTMMLIAMISLLTINGDPQTLNLHDLANRAKVHLGSCVSAGLLAAQADQGRYSETLATAANLVEPENDLKPPALWKAPGQYTFENADVILGAPGHKGWAQKNHMSVRGHVLVYARDDGYTLPGWLLPMEHDLSPDQAEALLRQYIHDVAGRYRGKIAMWDVVNEAIDDSENSRPFNLRNSFWFRKLGPRFLVLAFKYAHEADPTAKLYYNDYNIENGGRKAEDALKLAEYLRENGAPIDGIGLQYHIQLGNAVKPGDGHFKFLDEINAKGLSFMITELDIAIKCENLPATDPNFGAVAKNPEDLTAQADVYRGVFDMALSYPNCAGIQLWGFTDKHSWIPNYQKGFGAALDFDANYRPKLAAHAIAKALRAHAN